MTVDAKTVTLYSNTIVKEAGTGLKCRSCDELLCDEEQEWKSQVKLDERPLAEVAGDAYSGTSEDIMFRQFYCPSCGTLLDSEVALKGDPFLIDLVWD